MRGFENLLAVTLAFFVVAVSPGPANIAVATVSMRFGRASGLRFGLGLSLGFAFWGVVAATGLGALLQSSATALTALKVLGGLYLLWLACQLGRSAMREDHSGVACQSNEAQGRWFGRGLVLNLSNPKAVVAWMAALSMGLGGEQSVGFVIVATAVCIAIGFFNYAGYALAFSLPGFMAAYALARRWVETPVAGLFALAGFSLLRSAVSRA